MSAVAQGRPPTMSSASPVPKVERTRISRHLAGEDAVGQTAGPATAATEGAGERRSWPLPPPSSARRFSAPNFNLVQIQGLHAVTCSTAARSTEPLETVRITAPWVRSSTSAVNPFPHGGDR